jgi:hypothetical protein
MPWIWTATPSGHGPKAHGPVSGMHASGAGLGQPLGHGATEREAAVHEFSRQLGHHAVGALVEHVVPDPLDERDAVVDGCRPLAVEQVGRMDPVPAGAQLVGERAHAVGESLHVVEQHDFSHPWTLRLPAHFPGIHWVAGHGELR